MANYIATDTDITSVANAIRTKGGTSEPLEFPDGFVEAIEDIQAGSETEALNITENGTYTAPTGKAYSPITVNVPKYPVRVTDTLDEHGGTVRSIEVLDAVTFIDYDGTVVATKSKAEIDAMASDSDLPAFPTHEGLTAQGWNWTVAQLKAQLTAMPNQKVYVGQMYVTTSGATEIDVVMQEGRLEPIMTICVNGTVSVDWGDSTTPDSVTGSSLSTRLAVPHTYASAGSYTIKISGSQYAFYGSSTYTILRKTTTGNENRTYSNTIEKIRLGNGVKIQDYAFSYCYSLSSITIPSGVTSIGWDTFYYCYSLSSITIPSGVTSIGDAVLSSCYSLSSITIPSGVTNIGWNTFSNCYSLSSITMPSSVTSIGSNAFSYCYSLFSITIPSGVTSIGSNTFSYCNSLFSITIPSGVTSIGDSAFQGCGCLFSIIIPSSVTSIGNNAFYGCCSLSSIIIPSSVTSIGNNAFFNCYSLSSIIIPSSITSIGNGYFQNCFALASITVPSSVTSIGNTAFQYCYSLSSITIPSSVTSIGNSAFQMCYGVSEYHFQRETPPTGGTTIFNNISSDCVIYVPYSADHSILEAYKTATNWSTYASYMQEEPA